MSVVRSRLFGVGEYQLLSPTSCSDDLDAANLVIDLIDLGIDATFVVPPAGNDR